MTSRIKPAARFTPVPNLQVQDQFGTLTLAALKPAALQVPSAKSLVDFPPAPVSKNNEAPGAPTHTAHLLCYQIKQTSLPKSTPVSPLFVANQFGQESLAARSPRELCVPAVLP